MRLHNMIVNQTRITSLADAVAREASRSASTPIVVVVGCASLDDAEFSRLYLAARKVRELLEIDLWQEPVLLGEGIYDAVERERLRRGIEVTEA